MQLSVAMCTYNGALYVQEQLNSIASQTRLPDELVICDDCSGDGTRKIVEAFKSEAPFPVRMYVNQRNIGSSKNFEKAIGLCEGEVIALSDQDDVWNPDKLKRLETAFSTSPDAGLIFTDAEVVDENLRAAGYKLWQCVFNRRCQNLFQKGKALELLLQRNVITGATMAFRSKLRGLILPIPVTQDPSMIHDGWIAMVIASVADISFINEPLIMYRQHRHQQLGVALPSRSYLAKFEIAESPACALDKLANYYGAKMELICQLRERIVEAGGNFDVRKSIEAIETRIGYLQKQIDHIHSRAQANRSQRRLSRVPFVLKELLMFRYLRYSNGVFSAAKDLLS